MKSIQLPENSQGFDHAPTIFPSNSMSIELMSLQMPGEVLKEKRAELEKTLAEQEKTFGTQDVRLVPVLLQLYVASTNDQSNRIKRISQQIKRSFQKNGINAA